MAVVVPALEALRRELNDVAPNRDKTSDGGIGDQDHATRPSGHNPDETGVPEDTDPDNTDEIRARDFDVDLNRPGLTMEMICQYLVRECRAGRIRWIKYIIFNRRIWSAASGWVQRTYTGSNPHDKHMHVSCKPDTASENSTRPVGLASLVEDEMTKAEFLDWMNDWATSPAGQKAIGTAVGRSDTVPRLQIDGTFAPPTDMNPTSGISAVISFLHKDLWLVKRDLAAIKTGITTGNQRVAAMDVREAAEVPPTASAIAAAVRAAMPNAPAQADVAAIVAGVSAALPDQLAQDVVAELAEQLQGADTARPPASA